MARGGVAKGESGRAQRLFLHQRAVSRMLGEKSYLRYLRALWRSTAAFGWYSAALTVFRRIRLVRLILRIVQGLWLALQTGTLLLLLLPLLLVLIPCVLLLSLLMLLGGVLELRRMRSAMIGRMRGKTVVFLNAYAETFDQQSRASAFFRGQLCQLDGMDDVLTVVRSPYLFSMRGFGGKGFYWAERRESKRVYLVRTYGFFALRGIARQSAKKIILVS